ncbi:histone-lysine N-methyltransferase PRDM9-like [Tachysurus ichikawai]
MSGVMNRNKIYRKGKREEYIDAKREVCANWMRYVNCAHSEEAQNLVAVKYGGGILYRSCRPIDSEQELLVWYDENRAQDLSRTCDYRRNKEPPENGKV